jgi:hypothetical protein
MQLHEDHFAEKTSLERENHEESRFKKALAAAVVSLAVLSGTAATAAAPAHNDYRPCSEMRQPVPALPPVTVYVPAYANSENEVWLDFTTDVRGHATAESRHDWRFRPGAARSVVIHEHGTATKHGKAGNGWGAARLSHRAFRRHDRRDGHRQIRPASSW